jgi:Purple acid Phosphatase, N-terminal domain
MNMLTTVFALGLTVASGAMLQTAASSPVQQTATQQIAPQQSTAAAQASHPAPAVQQVPATPMGAPSQAVLITNGPVVEHVTDTTAEIAWSTNVNSGTALHYGTDATHLDLTVGMPWGGFTHRVSIKNLKPNTTYYFKAESGQGQGTGTQAETAQASFQTKPAGTTTAEK